MSGFTKLMLIMMLGLTGCASADLVRRTYQPTKGGVVRYAKGDAGNLKAAGREMHNFCAGPFTILEESDRAVSDGAFAQNIGGMVVVSDASTDYTFVQFKCDSDSKAAN